MKYVSASQLKLLMECMWAYYQKYILKRPDPPGPAAKGGTAVHAGNQSRMRGKSAHLAFKQAWRGTGMTMLGKHYDEMFECLENSIEMFPTPDASRIISVEERFELALAPDVDVVGYMDLVEDSSMDGSEEYMAITVHDWKTGWVIPQREEMASDIQAATYAMWAAEYYPFATITTDWHFLRHKLRMRVEWDREQLAEVRAWIVERVGWIRKHADDAAAFEPTVSGRCGYCPYRGNCPAIVDEPPSTAIPEDIAMVLDEKARAAGLAKVWKARAEQMDGLLKGHLDNGPFEHNGRRWFVDKSAYRKMDPTSLPQIAESCSLEPDIFDEALSVKVAVLEAKISTLPRVEREKARELFAQLVEVTYSPRLTSRKI